MCLGNGINYYADYPTPEAAAEAAINAFWGSHFTIPSGEHYKEIEIFWKDYLHTWEQQGEWNPPNIKTPNSLRSIIQNYYGEAPQGTWLCAGDTIIEKTARRPPKK